jgi:hypothetical protein
MNIAMGMILVAALSLLAVVIPAAGLKRLLGLFAEEPAAGEAPSRDRAAAITVLEVPIRPLGALRAAS